MYCKEEGSANTEESSRQVGCRERERLMPSLPMEPSVINKKQLEGFGNTGESPALGVGCTTGCNRANQNMLEEQARLGRGTGGRELLGIRK